MKLKSDVNKQTEHWGAKSLPKLSDPRIDLYISPRYWQKKNQLDRRGIRVVTWVTSVADKW